MGNNDSSSKEKVPQLTREQQMKIAQGYGQSSLVTYDHPETGFIVHRDEGVHAYEDVKYAEVTTKLGSAKNSNVKASKNDAYILPKTIRVHKSKDYSNGNVLTFDYKINVKSTVVVTLAAQPHKPDSVNPFEYESVISPELSGTSYVCDPSVNGNQNTISFIFNPSDFSSRPMTKATSKFYPCLIHIYAHYDQKPDGSPRQNENFLYCSFNYEMDNIKLDKNIIRIDGKNFEMQTVYGMAGDEDGSNTCLVCLENPRNIVLKPCSHMCIGDAGAEPMLHSGQKCPVGRTKIQEIEKIEIHKN